MSKVIKLEDVTVQWSYDKSDYNKTYQGKLSPRGKLITISLGEVDSEKAENIEELIESMKTLTKEKCKALGKKRVDVSCKSLKEIDEKYSISKKTELGLEFKLTTFNDKLEERVRTVPVIIQNGIINNDVFPFSGDVVDVEFTMNTTEFGGTYHLAPVLKTVIIKQSNSNRSGSKSESQIDLSELYNSVATKIDNIEKKDNKVKAETPKAKSKQVKEEDDEDGVSIDDIGLLD